MKKCNGFTLIELLAVIVILGVILTIATTSVIKNINDSKEKTKYMAAKEIVNMAEAYIANNGTDEDGCVNVEDMIPNYLDADVTNPLTGENRTESNNLSGQQVCKVDVLKQDDYAPKNNEVYCFDGFAYKLKSSSDISYCYDDSTTKASTTTTSTKKQSTIRCYQNGLQKTTFAPNTEFYCTIGTAISGVEYEVEANRYVASGYPKYENNRVKLKYTSTTTVSVLAAKTGYSIKSTKVKISNNTTTKTNNNGNEDSCLVEGTRIKTIDGYKNIEDIDYDDLLATWSYDLGKLVYEYPIWIEKESVSDSYQEITLSDGTILKTVGSHGIYSYDLNKFVSVDDKENFKVGTNVAKIENDKLKKVKVVKIEQKTGKVKYYHVESTRYYNVIANDLLTTDGYVDLSNIYQFDSNITWNGNEEILSNNDNLYNYKEFKNIVPYYLYTGLRMEEAKYLVSNNVITKQGLIDILKRTMLNYEMTKQPISKSGERYWMVTLSTNNLTENNKNLYLKKEGSIYILPDGKDIKYWYNASDNKFYEPGSKVVVRHGMHFMKISK